MKVAYTPIHPKFYLFFGIITLSLLALATSINHEKGLGFYILYALVYSVIFYKINFYDYMEIKYNYIYIPSFFLKKKIDLKNLTSFKSIDNNSIVFFNDNSELTINLGFVNENQIIEFETILENYGLKRI